MMLTVLFLAIAIMPMPMATASSSPAISLNPVSGPVGSLVTVNGSGFAPDTGVYISWNMSITGDFVGVGDNETTEFTLFFGWEYIVPNSERIYVDDVLQTRDVDYTIDYYGGVINFTVPPPAGMLQAVVITADYDIMIVLAMTTTDGFGNFTTTFTVPESYAGVHDVWAVSYEPAPVFAIASYSVEPQIVLSSTKGPPQAWITVSGTGFAANEEVDIGAFIFGNPYDGVYEESYAYADTDAYGTFAEAIALPSSISISDSLMNYGMPAVPIVIWAEDYTGNYDINFYIAVLWCESEPSSIYVDVEVGKLYFLGEILTVYALTSVDGVPTDIDDIEFSVYHETLGPMNVAQLLPIVHVDTGLYAVTTTLTGDTAPGNYLIEVKANKTTYWLCELVYGDWWSEWLWWFENIGEYEIAQAWDEFGGTYEGMWPVTIHGAGIEGFIVSPTLIGMNAMLMGIEGDIATISTNIGLIQLNLTAVNAKLISIQDDLAIISTTLGEIEVKLDDINATLVALNGTVATIQTDVGTIQTNVSNIKLAITSIEGDIATIKTTLGTVEGKITTIEGNMATIETDLGTVKADISDVKGVQETLTVPLYADVALTLIAAIGAILVVILMRRKTIIHSTTS